MTALSEISQLVRRETGIVLPAARAAATLAAVRRAAPGMDPDTFLRAAADPEHGRDLVHRLIDEITVQETAFARDRDQLDAIDWPGLLRTAGAAGSRTIRVWSAGCASGEEPYTLALLAAEAFAPARPPVDVLGTDISRAAIAAATAGRYRERAVRALEPSLRLRYLHLQADGSYLVGATLRGLVRVRLHNLVRDPVPPPGEPGFDLIVCRNVLIYLEEPAVGRVIASLGRALRPGGGIMLGAADALQPAARAAPWRPAGTAAVAPLPRTATPGPGAATPGPGTATPGPGTATRKPLRGELPGKRGQRLAAALRAADSGDRGGALAHVSALLAADPLDADAHFIGGLVALEAGDPSQAVTALRRALFADPGFGLAAFSLGRAYDALGDVTAAQRCYEVTLRTLGAEEDRHGPLLQQVNVGDIASACRARLSARPADQPAPG